MLARSFVIVDYSRVLCSRLAPSSVIVGSPPNPSSSNMRRGAFDKRRGNVYIALGPCGSFLQSVKESKVLHCRR
jgi:hypothetical protein